MRAWFRLVLLVLLVAQPVEAKVFDDAALYVESFGGIADDGLDDADAFDAAMHRCAHVRNRRNVLDYSVGVVPRVVLRSGSYYHLSRTVMVTCDLVSEGSSYLNWIGEAGGVMLRMSSNNSPGGSNLADFTMHGITFNAGSNDPAVGRVVVPNGYPRTNLAITSEPLGSAALDWAFTLDRVAFRRTSGPALLLDTGSINADLGPRIRWDDVDTAIELRLTPRSCQTRWRLDGFTAHGLRTFLRVNNDQSKCTYGIRIANARIEVLDNGAQTGGHSHGELIDYQYTSGPGSIEEGVAFDLSNLYVQVAATHKPWTVMHLARTNPDEHYKGLRPTISLHHVFTEGPLLGGEVHPDFVNDVTTKQSVYAIRWHVGRVASYRPWTPIYDLTID